MEQVDVWHCLCSLISLLFFERVKILVFSFAFHKRHYLLMSNKLDYVLSSQIRLNA